MQHEPADASGHAKPQAPPVKAKDCGEPADFGIDALFDSSAFSGFGDVQHEPADASGDGSVESSDRSDTDAESSDEEDIFHIKPLAVEHCPPGYKQCFLYRWKAAVAELSTKLRDNVLLPLVPGSKKVVYNDVQSGVALPSWHCAFADCDLHSQIYEESPGSTYSYEQYLWQHLDFRHGRILTGLAKKFKLQEF